MGDEFKDEGKPEDESEFEDEKERAEKLLKQSGQKDKKHSVARALALITQLGLQMAFCIIGGMLLGVFLDRWLGTAPLFIIIFAILGPAAAIKIIYDIAKDWEG